MDQRTLGRLQGFLRAFEHLNVGMDHAPSYDVEVVPWKGGLTASVRAHFCSYPGSQEASWEVSILPAEEGMDVLGPLLQRWLFDRRFGVPAGNDANLGQFKKDACVQEFLDLLTGLFVGHAPRVWKVDARPTGGGFYELVWDDVLLENGEELLLLHLGMSD
jgi:hypothetical protein